MFETMLEAVIGANVKLTPGEQFSPSHGQVLLDEDEDEHVHSNLSYTVVGRLPDWGSPWDRVILVPIEAVWRIHALPTGHAQHQLEIAAARRQGREIDWSRLVIGSPWDADQLPGVPAIVVKPATVRDAYLLRNEYRSNDATMAFFPAEVLLELYALLGDARFLFATMAVATQVLVIGAILLAVFAALALRRRQLGVLRALGASRGYVFSVIWLYIVAVITAGAVIGLALGWLLAMVLSDWVGDQTGLVLPVSLTFKEFAMAGALIGLGLVLAAIPSAAAYRYAPAALLRN
jgi:putative ABC transport system permease protein